MLDDLNNLEFEQLETPLVKSYKKLCEENEGFSLHTEIIQSEVIEHVCILVYDEKLKTAKYILADTSPSFFHQGLMIIQVLELDFTTDCIYKIREDELEKYLLKAYDRRFNKIGD